MKRFSLSLAALLLVSSASCGPCRECRDTEQRAGRPAQDTARGRPGSARTLFKPITKVRIVRGAGKGEDGVGLWIVDQPSTDYRAVFGGTRGGSDPATTGSDLTLDEGWVHLQGSFPAQRDVFRVPIVITNVVGIGADATEFIVQKDAVDDTSAGMVICLDGTVWISERSNYHVDKEWVPKDYYSKYWVKDGVVNIGPPEPIPADPAHPARKLADEAHALASKF
ncbi:MAG: hypothetical protein DYG92_06360 [Leptolyngbya sp. PLA1]|nr:hypothetical protein [Leptolyngbya sp. PLA1]